MGEHWAGCLNANNYVLDILKNIIVWPTHSTNVPIYYLYSHLSWVFHCAAHVLVDLGFYFESLTAGSSGSLCSRSHWEEEVQLESHNMIDDRSDWHHFFLVVVYEAPCAAAMRWVRRVIGGSNSAGKNKPILSFCFWGKQEGTEARHRRGSLTRGLSGQRPPARTRFPRRTGESSLVLATPCCVCPAPMCMARGCCVNNVRGVGSVIHAPDCRLCATGFFLQSFFICFIRMSTIVGHHCGINIKRM